MAIFHCYVSSPEGKKKGLLEFLERVWRGLKSQKSGPSHKSELVQTIFWGIWRKHGLVWLVRDGIKNICDPWGCFILDEWNWINHESTMNQPWISMNHRHLIFEYLRYLWVFQVQISEPCSMGSPGTVSTTSALGPSADAVGWTNASGIPS